MSKEQRLRNRKILIGLGAAAGVYALLPGLFAGSIEDNVRDILTEQRFDHGVAYKLVNYDRGWFRSTAKIGFVLPFGSEIDQKGIRAAKWIMGCTEDPEVTFCLDFDIDHGPIITEGGLRVAQAQFRSNWALPLVMKEVNAPEELIQGLFNPFRLNTSAVFNFDDSVDYQISTTPLKFAVNEAGQKVDIDVSALMINGTLAANKTDLSYHMEWDKGNFDISGIEDSTINFKDLESTGDINFANFQNPVVNALSLKAKMFKAMIEQKNVSFDLTGMDINLNGDVTSDTPVDYHATAVINDFQVENTREGVKISLKGLNAQSDGTMQKHMPIGDSINSVKITSLEVEAKNEEKAHILLKGLDAGANVTFQNGQPIPRNAHAKIETLNIKQASEEIKVALEGLDANLEGEINLDALTPGKAHLVLNNLTLQNKKEGADIQLSGLSAQLDGQMIAGNLVYGNSSMALNGLSLAVNEHGQKVNVNLQNMTSEGSIQRDGDRVLSDATLHFDALKLMGDDIPTDLIDMQSLDMTLNIIGNDANSYEELTRKAATVNFDGNHQRMKVRMALEDNIDALLQAGGEMNVPLLKAQFKDGALDYNHTAILPANAARSVKRRMDMENAQFDGELTIDQSLVKAFMKAFAHSELTVDGKTMTQGEKVEEMIENLYQRALSQSHMIAQGDKLFAKIIGRDGKFTVNDQAVDIDDKK